MPTTAVSGVVPSFLPSTIICIPGFSDVNCTLRPAGSFTDSDAIADWARGHINTLCAIGALSGYADGGIHPTEPITRAQVAATLFSMT